MSDLITPQDDAGLVANDLLPTEIMTLNQLTAHTRFSSNCTCWYCPKCESNNVGEETCEECAGVTVPSVSCDGDCWTWAYEDWKDSTYPLWAESVGSPQYLKIVGAGMGWRKLSGAMYLSASWKSVWDSLTLNGDWTLEFRVAGKKFTAQRWSHDEPMGEAHFEIIVCSEKEFEENAW